MHPDDEQHWASVIEVDGKLVIENVIVAPDGGTACAVGHPHLIRHVNGGLDTQIGIGWHSEDGGQTWSDARDEHLPHVFAHRRSS